jgi:hypothetical protein
MVGDYQAFEPFLNSSFAIVVCIYLLYERQRFNEKVTQCMETISCTMRDIQQDLKKIL